GNRGCARPDRVSGCIDGLRCTRAGRRLTALEPARAHPRRWAARRALLRDAQLDRDGQRGLCAGSRRIGRRRRRWGGRGHGQRLAAVPVIAACGSANGSSSGGGGHLNLVAYSTPKEAYAALIPAFQKTAAGKGVTFTQSFGPSGDQSRAVLAGLPADVVALSL